MYETEIYGRLPAKTPAVTWQVTETDAASARRHGGDEEDHRHDRRRAGRAADQADALHARRREEAGAGDPAGQLRRRSAAAATQGTGARFSVRPAGCRRDHRPGWGYATVGYAGHPARSPQHVHARASSACTLAPGQEQPAPDEWGTISAWSWGVSRMIDYLETDESVNAKQVALFGHSRLGKTALWATAKDERIAAVFSSCSGEMGAALARRDWGETVDDMAQNFPVAVRRQLSEVARPLERDARRRAHADRAERAAARVHHRRNGRSVGRSRRHVQGRRRGRARSTGCSARRISASTELPPLDTPVIDRRHRMALPHRRSHGDARRLEGVPRVSGEVFLGGDTQPLSVPGRAERAEDGGVEAVDVLREAQLAGRADRHRPVDDEHRQRRVEKDGLRLARSRPSPESASVVQLSCPSSRTRGEVERMLDADAARAERALVGREQLLARRVVQEDRVLVREDELDPSERVVGAGRLAQRVAEVRRASPPASRSTPDRRRGPADRGSSGCLRAIVFSPFRMPAEHVLREDRRRHGPVRIEHQVLHVGAERRRLPRFAPDLRPRLPRRSSDRESGRP